MELRFNIDDRLIEELQERTNTARASDLGREAFNFLNWGTSEVSKGRRILSDDAFGGDPCGYMTDAFMRARQREDEGA